VSTNLYTFIPANALIIAVTNSNPSTFTFLSPHNFFFGEIVSFRSSKPYGMYEINNLQALVLSITIDSITVSLDTTLFNSFVTQEENAVQYVAMCLPVASGMAPGQALVGNILQDAFDNVPTN
jgi:hypothetical protein